jgi:hypothetical protein
VTWVEALKSRNQVCVGAMDEVNPGGVDATELGSARRVWCVEVYWGVVPVYLMSNIW